jgi:hypothetical protein
MAEFYSTSANDIFTGVLNQNDFFRWTARGFGQDVISNFSQGSDRVDLSALGIPDWATLLPFISQKLGGSVISFFFNDIAEEISILNVLPSQLTASDFIFNTSPSGLSPQGSVGADILFGGSGNDTLSGGQGSDTLIGGAGTDTLNGGLQNDMLTGGVGSDVFIFNTRNFDRDVITDFVRGIDKINLANLGIADFATLSPFISESGGNSLISFFFGGREEVITVNGVSSNQLSASDFTFRVSADGSTPLNTEADDVLFGGNGADILNGGLGNDTLTSGSGNDILNGGLGIDRLTGGAGADIFTGTVAELSGDTISDFAMGDFIRFNGVRVPGAPAFTFSLSGNTLNFTGGSLNLNTLPAGTRLVAGPYAAPNAQDNGIELTLQRNVRNDFNGDGRSDILWRNSNGQINDWLANTNGTFSDNNQIVNQFVSLDFKIVGTGDFNGDGRSDILWRNVNGTLTNWLGTGNGGFSENTSAISQNVALAWKVVGTGDFNGDGRSDVLWRNDSGQISNWLGTANGGFIDNGNIVNQVVASAWKIAGTGDFNGDGRSDILWRNDSGTLTNWLGTGNGGFSENTSAISQNVALAWKVVGTGDFNGDGRSDVLWRNDSGQISNWLGTANGGFIDNGNIVNQVVASAWKIAGTGDFNGDGRSDILWRNDSGQLSEWLGTANGGFIDNGALVAQTVSNAWQIYIQDYQLL